MNKKCNKQKPVQKKNKNNKIKYICPNCHKNMKTRKTYNGYTLCAYCGMVILKIPFTFENIDAPGFIKIDPSRNKKKQYKKNKNKHHNLLVMKQFIDRYKQET